MIQLFSHHIVDMNQQVSPIRSNSSLQPIPEVCMILFWHIYGERDRGLEKVS